MLDQLRAMGVFACVVEKARLAVRLVNLVLRQAPSVSKSAH